MTIYRLLLLLYPRAFRHRYGAEMLRAFADSRRVARAAGPSALARFYVSSLRDVVLNAAAERAGSRGPRVSTRPASLAAAAGFMHDVSFALRMARRRPALAGFSAATLALGLGAVTAVASLAHAVLLRPLPFVHADRLVAVRGFVEAQPAGLSYENVRDLRDGSRTLAALTPFFAQSVNLTGVDEPDRIRGAFVTSDFFRVLAVDPQLGRVFGEQADAPGSERVVVITDGLWRRRFGARGDVLGTRMTLNNAPFTIIGVMPAAFDFPVDDAAAFLPFWTAPITTARDRHNYIAFGRLAPGVQLEDASAELSALAARLAEDYPAANRGRGTLVQPLSRLLSQDLTAPILILLGMVTLMLAAACANVAGLQLGAAAARRHEITIRAALGAGRARIVRQLILENVLRALAGAALGLLAGHAAVRALVRTAPDGLYGIEYAQVQPLVVLVVVTTAVAAGILVGLAPALQWTRRDAINPADTGSRTAGDARTTRFRGILVASQLAVATLLVVAAGLTTRTFVHLLHVDPGFEPSGLLTMEYRLPGNKYRSGEAQAAFHREVIERVRAVPGVLDAAGVRGLPFSGNGSTTSFRVPERREPLAASFNTVSDGYFDTMGIPLLAGRGFARAEREPVVVVSQSFAEATWPGANPLGRQLVFDEVGITATVIGVAGDVRHRSLMDDGTRAIYASHDQNPGLFNTLAVRCAADPMALAGAVRRAVWAIDPDQPVWKIRTAESLVARSLSVHRFLLQLVNFFGLSAALLSIVGVYGMVAASVAQRTREIGVRVALGATRGGLVRMILWQGARLGMLGIGAGLALALLSAQGVRGFLYGIDAHDPMTLTLAGATLMLATLAASFLPARRATRIDPAVSLRE